MLIPKEDYIIEYRQFTENEPRLLDTIRRLFLAYEKHIGLDLQFQGFEKELADLPGDYAKPAGTIIMAYARPVLDVEARQAKEGRVAPADSTKVALADSAKVVGCVALRPIATGGPQAGPPSAPGSGDLRASPLVSGEAGGPSPSAPDPDGPSPSAPGSGDLRPSSLVSGEAVELCEMKRLYVDPTFAGLGIGKELARRIVAQAREKGYKYMRLDTLPTMAAAQKLYESLGFYDIEPYVYNPVPGTRFMELKL